MIQGVEVNLGRRLTSCRVCNSKHLRTFLKLGFHPPSNEFLTKDEMDEPEVSFPLNAVLCSDCNFVQIDYVVKPGLLFTPDYPYNSSVSDELPIHFSEFAKQVVADYGLDSNSLVIDIGGNDGTLLKGFVQCGTKVLNVEPTERIMKISKSRGIDTIHAFWSEQTANKILSDRGPAKAIVCTNVFAHVDDLNDFLCGVDVLLDKDGIFMIESPYLVNLIENNEFDTIYHEHLSYLSVRPLKKLFARFGMEIVDVVSQNIHGGSIRIFVKKSVGNWKVKDSVKKFVDLEENRGLDKFETYAEFAYRVEKLHEDLLSLLRELKSKNKKIVGYGAAAKANTLLNHFRIGTDLLDYIVDKSTLKQGTFTPGMHIPVYSPEKIAQDKPDYILILPWNFKDEIMRQQNQVIKWGGKFIVPIPKVEVI